MPTFNETRTELTETERWALEFEVNRLGHEYGSVARAAKAIGVSQSAMSLASRGKSGSYICRKILNFRHTDMNELKAVHAHSIAARSSSAPPRHRPLEASAPMDAVSGLIQELGAASGWSSATMLQLELYRRSQESSVPLMKLVEIGEAYENLNVQFAATKAHMVNHDPLK